MSRNKPDDIKALISNVASMPLFKEIGGRAKSIHSYHTTVYVCVYSERSGRVMSE